ncbi:MAG: type II toxin-antitoxin system PemK/MazF family toxin [Thermodesulfobacteriota bacterium]|nr:type II toxin-antitoxin system PemK/MazF family toxin [Thermodesulfobacteriota bacterium]
MDQGDIYLVNLDPVTHTETGKTRPGIILSVHAMNYNSPRLVVATITSSMKKIYPFEVAIPTDVSGPTTESNIMLDQVRSLDKRRLVKKLGVLDKERPAKACAIVQKLISLD